MLLGEVEPVASKSGVGSFPRDISSYGECGGSQAVVKVGSEFQSEPSVVELSDQRKSAPVGHEISASWSSWGMIRVVGAAQETSDGTTLPITGFSGSPHAFAQGSSMVQSKFKVTTSINHVQ